MANYIKNLIGILAKNASRVIAIGLLAGVTITGLHNRTSLAPPEGLIQNQAIYKDLGKKAEKQKDSIVKVRKSDGKSFGTGWILFDKNYIITNVHVVGNGAKSAIVEIFENDTIPNCSFVASVIYLDPTRDIAILRIDDPVVLKAINQNALGFQLDDGDRVVKGTPIHTIGMPFGYSKMLTAGIISYIMDDNEDRKMFAKRQVLLLDLSIFPGNSGGPMIDSETGKVVGIITFTLPQFDNDIGGGVSATEIKAALDQVEAKK